MTTQVCKKGILLAGTGSEDIKQRSSRPVFHRLKQWNIPRIAAKGIVLDNPGHWENSAASALPLSWERLLRLVSASASHVCGNSRFRIFMLAKVHLHAVIEEESGHQKWTQIRALLQYISSSFLLLVKIRRMDACCPQSMRAKLDR